MEGCIVASWSTGPGYGVSLYEVIIGNVTMLLKAFGCLDSSSVILGCFAN
jgi:hypothetical protein